MGVAVAITTAPAPWRERMKSVRARIASARCDPVGIGRPWRALLSRMFLARCASSTMSIPTPHLSK